MEEQMAMHDIRLPARLALTRPCSCEHDAVPVQPLVQALTKLREELAVGIVSGVREAPVDREMGHQREVDRFCKSDSLHDAGGLAHGDVPARAKLPLWLCRRRLSSHRQRC